MSEAFNISDLWFHPDFLVVAIGTILLGSGAALVGCFTFLRKRALVGDVVAHSILPGVCLAFLVSGSKNPLILLGGAVLTGWLSLLAIDWINRYSKLKPDTAIALVLSVFFGVGIMLLTTIQHSGNASQAGLDKFLFGKAASMTLEDVQVFGGISVLLIVIVALFFKEFKLISFNPDFARVIGLPVRFLEFLLATLTVLAVATGIQAVGVVLMAALLITPAAAARFWTHKLGKMIFLAIAFGAISGLSGSVISYSAPAMPTGPWVVMILSFLAIGSAFVAPQKGILARLWLQRDNQRKILTENILKAFFHLGERTSDYLVPYGTDQIQDVRSFSNSELQRGLRILQHKRLVNAREKRWTLTKSGLEEASRVVRLHRLWELYLNKHMRIEADHVHNDAEAIEHVITPEVEALLEKELGFPEQDPHSSNIPYYSEDGKRLTKKPRHE